MSTFAICSVFAFFTLSYAHHALVVTEAGWKPYPAAKDIVVLRSGAPSTVCVERYPNGISIRCDVVSRGSVTFLVNGRRVRKEGRSPYHIAGDRDSRQPLNVFRWTGFRKVYARSDGSRFMTVSCQFKDYRGYRRSFSRWLIVEGPGCHHYW